MQTRVRAALAVIALLPAGQSVHAQAGTADLRYRAPLPASVTYVTIDSMWTATSGLPSGMSGLPFGDVRTTTWARAVNELSFAAVDDGLDVTAVLEELQGTVATPMGDMPITAGNIPAVTIRMTERGPDPEDIAGKMATQPVQASPGDVMGSAKAGSGLLTLPGRELGLGETWSDTVRMSPEVEGLKGELVIVTHGTYSADTVHDGRTVNVLQIQTEMTMSMNGAVGGIAMTHQMVSSTRERVLWDSARHYSLSRDAVGQVRTEMSMPDHGMTTVMTGRTRSITTAQPES